MARRSKKAQYESVRRSTWEKGRSYKDKNGRVRRVDTVADYARILEYSEKRQLRHLTPAFEARADDAAQVIYNELMHQFGSILK